MLKADREAVSNESGGRLPAQTARRCLSHTGVAVRTLPCLGLGGPVVYASGGSGAGIREQLVASLMEGLARKEPRRQASIGRASLTLRKDRLGRPLLFVGGAAGPAVSFSHAGGRTWAALSDGRGVGIDAALPEEFYGAYPLARAFRPGELNWGLEFCCGDPVQAPALLWSLKEAAIKAIGCGFNLFDPLDVLAAPPRVQGGWLISLVKAGRPLRVWARREGRAWLSMALVQ
jgi:hypothetical protein